jgi:colanic acid/amylovoran biosynthesis protein
VPLNGAGFGNDERCHRELLHDLADLGDAVRCAPSGLNAPQTKQLIAGCRYFIGARTHATIAAMSSGVPTLSIAYSVKARGINLDLFGHERYVLDTRQLDANGLAAGLALLRDEEPAIRALYAERLPAWRVRAEAGVEALAALLHERQAAPVGA